MKTTIRSILKHLSLGLVLTLGLSTAANAALATRSMGGGTNNSVYDDVLNITWLANANLAATETFGTIGINSNGTMNWNIAQNWVAAMNAADSGAGYLGVTTWRQSTNSTCSGFNCNSSTPPADELGYHFYDNFGAIAGSSILAGSNTTNLALFSNIQDLFYWTGTESGSGSAFRFRTGNGGQGVGGKVNFHFVWAVAPGDVAAVPVPAAVWLMGSALLGLVGVGRKRKR